MTRRVTCLPSQFRRQILRLQLILLQLMPLSGACSVSANERETRSLPGLRQPVSIQIDRWGVGHIRAESEHDLFFAQGYHAACNRLFQLELFRRQATGTVAELLGRRALDRDRGARLLRFRGNLPAEYQHYHPRGEFIIKAFVAGINARIAEVRAHPELLPWEFEALACEPQPWTPEVVISRHQGLVHNLSQELELGRSVAMIGPEQVLELVDFHPGTPRVDLDPAIDRDSLKEDLLHLYREARSPIQFLPSDIVEKFRPPAVNTSSVSPFREGWSPSFTPEAIDLQRDIGSNNWVVSGRRSRSGKPLLANDPHRALHLPSLRYFVHLQAPGWNVIGGGEPVLPGVSIGHNQDGAWGLTIFRIDAEDLYVYETDPQQPTRYRYAGTWESMQIIQETIPVKGEAPATVELHFTRHGPVLFQDQKRHRAYALRAGWLQTGAAPYLASLRMNTARNWQEFREACAYSRLPGLNMVWADRHGDIGWQTVGVAPRRPNWNGLVPVPGDGRFEWDGFLPIPELPHTHNPQQGFWNTSNEARFPENYPHRDALGWTWADPFRGDRVREVLSSSTTHNLDDMAELQHDELSIPARQLVPQLLTSWTRTKTPRELEIFRMLQDWDYQLRSDSIAAAVYVQFERNLEDALRDIMVPEIVGAHLPEISMTKLLKWIQNPPPQFGPSPEQTRNHLLQTSLDKAIHQLQKDFGDDVNNWKYGQPPYKHVRFTHPLADIVSIKTASDLQLGPLSRGGNGFTVNNTGRTNRQLTGATFRVVIDTADWDTARATNAPGQSGDANSPYYGNLLEEWNEGTYFPLYYTAEKLKSVAAETLQLIPAP